MIKELSHQTILALIGKAIPQELQGNMIIIGSLAAAYSFFDEQSGEGVRTKDVDCMLSPGTKAVPVARDVTQKLLDNAWTYRSSKEFPTPGTKKLAAQDLPLVRLNPPGATEWFIELLCPPSASNQGKAERNFERVETDKGHFALVSFGFFNLLEHEPISGPENLRIANPSMMALCNLHVVDLALGHLKALACLQDHAECRAINPGTGVDYSVLDMVRAFELASGKPVPYQVAPRRAGDIASCYADPAQAWALLGWRAERGLDAMCVDAWRWQRNSSVSSLRA